MSEAVDANSFHQLGEAFVVARPEALFGEKLEKFYNDISRRQLGGRALDLYSDRRLRVFNDPVSDETMDMYPDMTNLKRLSAMQTDLLRRGRLHPPVLPDVKVAPDTRTRGDTREKPGIKLHFRIAIDNLTALALQHSFVNADGTLPVHLTIARVDMRLGSELPNIRDELLEALHGMPPLTVEGLHIPPVRPRA